MTKSIDKKKKDIEDEEPHFTSSKILIEHWLYWKFSRI